MDHDSPPKQIPENNQKQPESLLSVDQVLLLTRNTSSSASFSTPEDDDSNDDDSNEILAKSDEYDRTRNQKEQRDIENNSEMESRNAHAQTITTQRSQRIVRPGAVAVPGTNPRGNNNESTAIDDSTIDAPCSMPFSSDNEQQREEQQQDLDETKPTQLSRTFKLVAVFLCLVAISVVTSVLVLLLSSEDTEEEPPSQSDNVYLPIDLDKASDLLKFLATYSEDVTKQGSPQYEAYQWLQSRVYFDIMPNVTTDDQAYEVVELFVLATLYYSTDGPNWVPMTASWPPTSSGASLCSNKGTVCMPGSSYFNNLDLESANLQGTIPSELGLLTRLEYLIFRDNPNLAGTLPTELGELTRLREYTTNDSYTLFVSVLIPQIDSFFTATEEFRVVLSSVSGTIPEEYTRWSNIGEKKIGLRFALFSIQILTSLFYNFIMP